MIVILVALLLAVGFTAFGLWWTTRGEAHTVVGDGNAFTAYYGKNHFVPNAPRTPPCQKCINRGCIGAGECRCHCHRKA